MLDIFKHLHTKIPITAMLIIIITYVTFEHLSFNIELYKGVYFYGVVLFSFLIVSFVTDLSLYMVRKRSKKEFREKGMQKKS